MNLLLGVHGSRFLTVCHQPCVWKGFTLQAVELAQVLSNVRGGDVEGARHLLNEKETCAAHLLPCLTAVLNND